MNSPLHLTVSLHIVWGTGGMLETVRFSKFLEFAVAELGAIIWDHFCWDSMDSKFSLELLYNNTAPQGFYVGNFWELAAIAHRQ